MTSLSYHTSLIKSLGHYTWQILSLWVNTSILLISIPGTILSYLEIDPLGIDLPLPYWGWLIVVFLNLHAAGFRVYRSLQKKVESNFHKGADIELRLDSISFGNRTWHQYFPEDLRFLLSIGVQNKGNESGMLRPISVSQFNMGTTLLSGRPINIKWQETPRARTQISFPHIVEPRKWGLWRACSLGVRLQETDPEIFAKRLHELDKFSIELKYEYEKSDGSVVQKRLLISGTFKDFQENVIQHWKKGGQSRLVEIAMGRLNESAS